MRFWPPKCLPPVCTYMCIHTMMIENCKQMFFKKMSDNSELQCTADKPTESPPSIETNSSKPDHVVKSDDGCIYCHSPVRLPSCYKTAQHSACSRTLIIIVESIAEVCIQGIMWGIIASLISMPIMSLLFDNLYTNSYNTRITKIARVATVVLLTSISLYITLCIRNHFKIGLPYQIRCDTKEKLINYFNGLIYKVKIANSNEII